MWTTALWGGNRQGPARGEVVLHASVELLQELSFHRARTRDSLDAMTVTRRLAQGLVVHDLAAGSMDVALGLMVASDVRGRDAMHAATALIGGFDHLMTLDQDFVAVPGFRIIQPAAL